MILKTVIITVTPILIKEAPTMFKAIREWFFPAPVKIVRTRGKKRKPVDTTKITQEMYDYVLMLNMERLAYNKAHPKNRHTLDWLVVKCNKQLKMKKSKSVYMDIISSKRDRSKLSPGTPIITKE